MDETLERLRNVAEEQHALGTAAFEDSDFPAAAVAFKHAAVATEAANAFEDATTETEVFSTRAPIVKIAGNDAERRHAALLKIFARLREGGLKESLVQAIAHLPESMLVDKPRVEAITENAVKTYHMVTQKEKGEDDIQDEHMHLNEFIDLVSCVEAQVVGGDLSEIELVYLDSSMPKTMAALLLSQPRRIAWRLMRVVFVFAIMLAYIMFGGAIFQLLEQPADVQASAAYLAEWESLSATIDASIADESERKFTLVQAPTDFNSSASGNLDLEDGVFNIGVGEDNATNSTAAADDGDGDGDGDGGNRARRTVVDMYDHPWFDAVSDELWSSQQHRRGFEGARLLPAFEQFGQDGTQADAYAIDQERDAPRALQKRQKRTVGSEWTEVPQHWLTRGCNEKLVATTNANWKLNAQWGNDHEAIGQVLCCRDNPDGKGKHSSVMPGCRVRTNDGMCWGGDPLNPKEPGPLTTYDEAVALCATEGRRLCSKAELTDNLFEGSDDHHGCCGAGCDSGHKLTWTSDLRPVITPLPLPPTSAHWLQRGCVNSDAFVKQNEERSGWGADEDALGRVECCDDGEGDGGGDDGGGTCSRKDATGVCYSSVSVNNTESYALSTFAEAEALCKADGRRLCTIEETAEIGGKCCNTGCSGDYPLTWTSGEKPAEAKPTGKHYLEDGCDSAESTAVPTTLGNDEEKLGEVQCCSIYGGDCRRQTANKTCYSYSKTFRQDAEFQSATFAEAVAICAADGRVLCSREELLQTSCCQKGCGHDHWLTWTRDTEVTTTTTTTTTTVYVAADAIANMLETDDVYSADDPDQKECWEYFEQDVTVSYKPEAGRVSTGDFGIDKCFFQYYTEKSLNTTDKIIAILNSQLESLNAEVVGLRSTLEQTDNARCAQPTSAEPKDSNWNYWGSCFFTMTLATTIGYGNFVPVTSAGQWFAIVYGIFGILLYMPLLAILSSSMWLPLMDTLVLKTNFRNWAPTSSAFKWWYAFTTTVMVLAYLVVVSALHQRNTNLKVADPETDGWDYAESVYYSVMTFTTIGLGDRVVEQSNSFGQMFSAIFSSIFGLSLLASYLGQYGQWATAAAATSPVDVSHTMAYGGDGPFVDDATYPTRRSSLQQALDREGNSSAKSTSTTIEKRLNAVFVLGTTDILLRRASFAKDRQAEITFELNTPAEVAAVPGPEPNDPSKGGAGVDDGGYLAVADNIVNNEDAEEIEETGFGFENL